MNKPAVVGSVLVLGLVAFVAGRYSGGPSAAHSASSRHIIYYVDPMHPAYHSDKPGIAPDCGMALEPVYEGDDPAAKLQLPAGAVALSPEKQQLIGTRVETVAKTSGSRQIRTTGRVSADDNRVYSLVAVTDGRVQTLGDNPAGTTVKKGDVLATFYSREFRNAEQAYLGSLTSIDRLKNLGKDPDDMGKNGNGDANLRLNEEQLRALGMGEPQLKELARTRQLNSDIEVASPVDGLVLTRNISKEQRFEGHIEMYRIADLSKIWIFTDLQGDEATLLHPGARVEVTVRELGKTLLATVSTAPPVFDPVSRTLKLRLEADNPGFMMRPDMYVDVEFSSKAPAGISVPAEAVLDSGLHKIVYVESSEGVFEPREVEVGAAFGNRVAVTRGLTEGDRVVTAGNFMIDSESRMRAPAPQSAMAPAATHADPPPMADSMSHPAAHPAAKPMSASMPMADTMATGKTDETVDPACGMPLTADVVKAAKYNATYHGHKFVFCSENCQKKFKSDPAKYAGEKMPAASSAQSGAQGDTQSGARAGIGAL